MYLPDCSGAEGGGGAGGDVGVVLGVQLIINSVLQGGREDKSRSLSALTHTQTQTHFNRGFTVASCLLATNAWLQHGGPLENWLCTNKGLNIVANNQAVKNRCGSWVYVRCKVNNSAKFVEFNPKFRFA